MHLQAHTLLPLVFSCSCLQVVTHQHSTIKRACDRLIFLHEGRVVWEGSVSEFDTSDEPIVRQFASGSLHGPMKYK